MWSVHGLLSKILQHQMVLCQLTGLGLLAVALHSTMHSRLRGFLSIRRQGLDSFQGGSKKILDSKLSDLLHTQISKFLLMFKFRVNLIQITGSATISFPVISFIKYTVIN